MNWLLSALLAILMPMSAAASLSAELIWNPSAAPAVTGYNIYYGGASHQYTNSVSVGNGTNAIIPGLAESTPYFFAATAHDSNGNESAFSTEGAFAVFTTPLGGSLQLATLPMNFTGDPLVFSLAANAPAGATINPTNGVVDWTPGQAYAATTNYINVMAADTVNPALSISETLVILVLVPTYTLTYTAGANGTISGTTPQTVNQGGSGSPGLRQRQTRAINSRPGAMVS